MDPSLHVARFTSLVVADQAHYHLMFSHWELGGKWNQEPDVPVSWVDSPEAACVDSSIFLLSFDQLLHLDTDTNTWSMKAAPPQQYYSITLEFA